MSDVVLKGAELFIIRVYVSNGRMKNDHRKWVIVSGGVNIKND